MGFEWSVKGYGRFTTEKRAPSAQCIGDWMRPGADTDVTRKVPVPVQHVPSQYTN